jgi:hypothetical protein
VSASQTTHSIHAAIDLPASIHEMDGSAEKLGYFISKDGQGIVVFEFINGAEAFALNQDQFVAQIFVPFTQVLNELQPGEHLQIVATVRPRSFQRHFEATLEKINSDLPAEYQVYPPIYSDWLESFSKESNFPDFRFYFLFRGVGGANVATERGIEALVARGQAYADRFSKINGIRIHGMSREEILKMMDHDLNPGLPPDGPGSVAQAAFDLDKKAAASILARNDISEAAASLLIGDQLARTIFLREAPDLAAVPFMPKLLSQPNPFRFSLHVVGIGQNDLIESVKNVERTANNRINQMNSEGRTIPAEATLARQQANSLLLAHKAGEIRFCEFAATVTFFGRDRDDLNHIQDEILQIFSECKTNMGSLAQMELFSLSLPLCSFPKTSRILDVMKGVRSECLTSECSRLFPAFSNRLGTGADDAGVFLGLSSTREPVHHYLFTEKFPNSIVVALGVQGRGKSFLANKFLLSLNPWHTFRVIIDRSQSYTYQLELFNGQIVNLTLDAAFSINIFDLSLDDLELRDDNQASVGGLKVSLVSVFICVIVNKENDAVYYGLVERLVYRAYKSLRISELLTGYRDKRKYIEAAKIEGIPTLSDFFEAIHVESATESKISAADRARLDDLATALGPYIDGSKSKLFNGRTSVKLDKDFILFDTSNLPDEDQRAVNILVTGFIKQKFSANKYKYSHQLLMIDELWYLAGNAVGAKFLMEFSRLARHFRAALYGITQQIGDFLRNELAASLLKSAPVKYIHGVDSSDLEIVKNAMNLNEVEREQIAALSWRKGQYSDVFAIYGDLNRGVVRVFSDPLAYWIATTDKNDRPLKERIKGKWTFPALDEKGKAVFNPVTKEPVFQTDIWAAMRELASDYKPG